MGKHNSMNAKYASLWYRRHIYYMSLQMTKQTIWLSEVKAWISLGIHAGILLHAQLVTKDTNIYCGRAVAQW